MEHAIIGHESRIIDVVPAMQKILIVEDEQDIAETLELFIQHQGYQTLCLNDGKDVVETVRRERPSLIVLDLMLPNKDGLTCCEEIRQFSNVPIIMLTAKVSQGDKLQGLEHGADDYVCKPFDAMELVLRIKAILNRTCGNVQYDVIKVVSDKREVKIQGQAIALSALEFNLFELLFNAPERIYSREQIIELAYPHYRDITDRTIDSHVKNIRKKFKEAGVTRDPIQSVYGAGYRFCPN